MLSRSISELRVAVARAEAVRARLNPEAPHAGSDPLLQLRQWRLASAVRYVGKSLRGGSK